MARKSYFLLAVLSILIGSGVSDWNILNHRKKNNVVSGSGLKTYCESWRINVEVNNIREFEVVPQECIGYIGKYMSSSQYKADCERAIEECQVFLSSCCNSLKCVDVGKMHGYLMLMTHCCPLCHTSRLMDLGWMEKSKAPALDSTLGLFNEIKGRGYKIFLISTRRESLRDATVENLIKVGYHGWSRLILRDLNDENKRVQHYKAEARKKLVNEGYNIWGIIGDQWSSFDGNPTAKRTFKLPNSLYYVS
ncbi:HAD superfamily [Abeliophyllum distichum]|uniref:HAD superfamily n=1 Tax=Abeliophyllum distichum TaxID=126358 RepID=A0ABD1NQY2_9LAMI